MKLTACLFEKHHQPSEVGFIHLFGHSIPLISVLACEIYPLLFFHVTSGPPCSVVPWHKDQYILYFAKKCSTVHNTPSH